MKIIDFFSISAIGSTNSTNRPKSFARSPMLPGWNAIFEQFAQNSGQIIQTTANYLQSTTSLGMLSLSDDTIACPKRIKLTFPSFPFFFSSANHEIHSTLGCFCVFGNDIIIRCFELQQHSV